jgi:uncharacterized protein
MTKRHIIKIIQNDDWMMDVLKAAKTLTLPDWWIGAGFVRNKVWDVLHGYKTRTPLHDIDVIYFDPGETKESQEKVYEKRLQKLLPNIPWSVKNQARMQKIKHDKPYKNAADGMAHWVETATCIGVKLDESNKAVIAAPHGIADLVSLKLRSVSGQKKVFEKRLKDKNWLAKWPRLTIINSASDS